MRRDLKYNCMVYLFCITNIYIMNLKSIKGNDLKRSIQIYYKNLHIYYLNKLLQKLL